MDYLYDSYDMSEDPYEYYISLRNDDKLIIIP